jgi:hypothetical protein
MGTWRLMAAAMGIWCLQPGQRGCGAEEGPTDPRTSKACVDCHVKEKVAAAAIEWKHSTHAKEEVALRLPRGEQG